MKDNEKDIKKDIKKDIINVSIELFNKHGMKFTMDDVAKALHISKKTIYKHFADKNMMIMACIDYCFELVKVAEEKIMNDKTLDDVEKLKKVIVVMPDGLGGIDWIKVSDTVNTNPELYEHYTNVLEKDWEFCRIIFNKCVEEGRLQNISFDILKIILESGMEGLIKNLKKTKVKYTEALDIMVDVVISGLEIKK